MSEAAEVSKKAKTEYLAVAMKDGRTVEFPGNRRMQKEVMIERENGRVAVRFDFRNGETATYEVPKHLLLDAAGHGLSQKLGDNVAGLKNEDKSPASEDDMFLEVEGLYERLAADGSSWNQVSEGGGFGGQSILAKALVEFSGLTPEAVKEFLKGKSQAEKLALRDESKQTGKTGLTLKEIVDRFEKEKKSAAAQVDTAALLAGLPKAE